MKQSFYRRIISSQKSMKISEIVIDVCDVNFESTIESQIPNLAQLQLEN